MDIYQQQIIENYKTPMNFGEIPDSTYSFKQDNPLCGDQIEVFILEDAGKIKDIKFKGNGCAISQASASLLTQKLKGKEISEIKDINPDYVFEILGLQLTPARQKCALLSLTAIKNAIKN